MTDAHSPQPITDYQLQALTAPLNPSRVSRRSQGGRSLSYVEAWDIKATLIRVFGFGGFSAEVTDTQIVQLERDVPKSGGGTTNFRVTAMCTLRLTIHQTGAVYSESAAASQAGADIGEVTDFAIKTAESDALKRCAINLGTHFGLSLYNDGSTDDVVKVVLAPGQVWTLDRRAHLEAQQAAQIANAIVEGRPAAAQQGPPPGSAQTPEQYAETQALIARGLRMKQEQAEEPKGIDFARMAEEAAKEPGVPVALDPSLEEGFETQHTDTVSS